jgi:RNA dependent RNA polymerase
MEVFIRNLPEQTTEKRLRKFLKPYLEALSINTFSCEKMQRARIATLTFLYPPQGQLFLMRHGQRETKPGVRVNYPNVIQLRIMDTPIFCSASNKAPDTFQIRALEAEARAGTSRSKPAIDEKSVNQQKAPLVYSSSYASCGVWSYEGSELVFVSHLQWMSPGEIKFGARRMMLTMGATRIEFAYSWIQNIAVGGPQTPSMTITCRYAPKFSQKTEETELEALIKVLNIKVRTREKRRPPWKRLSTLGVDHENIVSSCLVYRIGISSPSFNEQIRNLKMSFDLPPTIYLRTHVRLPREALVTELGRLQHAFTSSFKTLPFAVKFQMQKLAQDGYLPPSTVIKMFPDVVLMVQRSGVPVTISALKKLFFDVPYRGPETEAHEFHVDALLQALRKNEDRAKREELYLGGSAGTSEPDNIAIIYRAKVTPAGVYLYGPEPETKNRVLRKYNDHLEYFLRVQFCDEDGEQVRFDPRTSNDDIFYVRFKKVLEDGIDIAGRNYGFLGFSHSSLRSQTCWFMAPFVQDGKLQLYQLVIANLGDFSRIHSPAKCAARIGQAFSDTPNTVPLGSIVVKQLPDVERNGRVFSDGVGTFSGTVLEQIWDALPSKRLVKPTAFQIRLLGMMRPFGRFIG